MAQPPVDRAREAAAEQVEKARLTFRRLSGLDRTGPTPPATLPDAPWHVWTLPNGIGLARLALIPLFLVLGLTSETGTDPVPSILFAAIAWAEPGSVFTISSRPASRSSTGRSESSLRRRSSPAFSAPRPRGCRRCAEG